MYCDCTTVSNTTYGRSRYVMTLGLVVESRLCVSPLWNHLIRSINPEVMKSNCVSTWFLWTRHSGGFSVSGYLWYLAFCFIESEIIQTAEYVGLPLWTRHFTGSTFYQQCVQGFRFQDAAWTGTRRLLQVLLVTGCGHTLAYFLHLEWLV